MNKNKTTIIYYLFISFFCLGASADLIEGSTLKDYGGVVSMLREGMKEPEKAELLEKEGLSMLLTFKEHFGMPSFVSMYNEYGGPMYDNTRGSILARYPFHYETSSGKTLVKSYEDSIAIHLHEIAHQLVDERVNRMKGEEAVIAWAFRTRMDMKGEWLSREKIDEMKADTSFADKDTDWLMDHFFSITGVAVQFEEFFADAMTVLYTKDPDAIYKSISFSGDPSLEPWEQESMKAHDLRRFDVEHDIAYVEEEAKSAEHAALALARTYLWREIFVKKSDYGKKFSESLIADKIFTAMVSALKEITNNFTETGDRPSAAKLNEVLIRHIDAAFQ